MSASASIHEHVHRGRRPAAADAATTAQCRRGQSGGAVIDAGDRSRLLWLFLASDPTRRSADESLVGGILTWVKAMSLICLVCWVVSWLLIGVKERIVAQGPLV